MDTQTPLVNQTSTWHCLFLERETAKSRQTTCTISSMFFSLSPVSPLGDELRDRDRRVRDHAEVNFQVASRGAEGRFGARRRPWVHSPQYRDCTMISASEYDNQLLVDRIQLFFPQLYGRIALGSLGKCPKRDWTQEHDGRIQCG